MADEPDPCADLKTDVFDKLDDVFETSEKLIELYDEISEVAIDGVVNCQAGITVSATSSSVSSLLILSGETASKFTPAGAIIGLGALSFFCYRGLLKVRELEDLAPALEHEVELAKDAFKTALIKYKECKHHSSIGEPTP